MRHKRSVTVSVECLIPLQQQVWPPLSGPAMMIVLRFDVDGESNDTAILTIALIRDCFLAEGKVSAARSSKIGPNKLALSQF